MPHCPPALQSQPHLSDVLCIHLDTFPSLAAVWLSPHLRTCATIRDRLQAHTLGCALRLAATNLLKWRMGRRPHQAAARRQRDGFGSDPFLMGLADVTAATAEGPSRHDQQRLARARIRHHSSSTTLRTRRGTETEPGRVRRTGIPVVNISYGAHPPETHPEESRISIPLYNLEGNMYVNAQDAPHARKTARNNIFSGARGLVLGDFVVHYKQLYDMAMTVPDPTLYERDVIRADRQDDNAAHRVFSAATLQGLADNVDDNMGIIVFLFVVGELVDAYESRIMSHACRAKVALRARLFLKTWKLFLQKLGYSIHRHYLPPGATKFFDFLIDGLLGLILIHRDHLPTSAIPLLPWKHESMANERVFAALRGIFPEMSLVQAILALPHLRATMSRAKQALFSKASYKKVANGYTFSDAAEDAAIDFKKLAIFPTDVEFTAIYGEALEENDMLWSLLNVHIPTLTVAPVVETVRAPIDPSDNSDVHLTPDDSGTAATDAAIVDLSMKDELQEALRVTAVQNVTGLLKNEEEEIDACAYAAAALVVDGLSKIDDLPDLDDPAHLEQSRKDIARIIKMTPESVESFLHGLKSSFGGTTLSSDVYEPPILSSLLDVTASDLLPLVRLRESYQTEPARTGIRNYRPGSESLATIPGEGSASPSKESSSGPSDKQLMARRIQAVIRQAEARKVNTGLNRKARTEENEVASPPIEKPSGNAANAAYAAQVRSTTALRRRRNVCQNLKCHSFVGEAGIGPLTPLAANNFIFLIDRNEILLGRVITIYSKAGGKAGAHAFIEEADTIGSVSFVLAQTYEHAAGRTFRRVHSTSVMVGVSRFAHLPSGSILFRVPDKVTQGKQNFVELSSATTLKFKELLTEKKELLWAATVLNTVQRRGADNVNIVDIEEDDDVDN
ncbi:hypothetical protein GGX14DRAFT_578036 [Mycena pura]|uniref:Uncharacterized protein n=1 Tax=Mycena pura TaxID=153505 RepID=A0AAD6Y1S4_9AGAR|nr:hypothetical protein GGX14DRAFT_578036 [Mycena pura]